MEATDVKRALVVGAGVMGHSIAQVFATAGIETSLVDISSKVLDHAMTMIAHNLKTLGEYGRIDTAAIPAIRGRIHTSTDIAAAAKNIDFALEAVVEVPEVKRQVFIDLEAYTPPHAILASNTSGLEIFNIIEAKQPSRFVIAHWLNPAHIMPMVEVVGGPQTSPGVVAFTAGLMERVGKRPVVMRQFVRSFIVNRLQNYIFMAVMEMLDKGWATADEIDYAAKMSLGVRLPILGVVQTYDFTGLDIVADLVKSYGASYPIIEDRVKEGNLGVKTGKGLFDYAGRSQQEVTRKRDVLLLKMCDFVEKLNDFRPV